MMCKLKSCEKCSGDLVLDTDEWRCWQCGHYYYPKIDLPELPLMNGTDAPSEDPSDLPGAPQRRRRRSRWAVRDINALIVAKDRSEQRWWNRNQQLIQYLDEGRSVREISALVGRSERQVRVVREQLNDLRAVADPDAVPVESGF
ncbi:MAG: helix-turn-helix domain-containing protein [Dehalococcoidia bacterium]